MSTELPMEDDLAASSVFRKPPARAWVVSFAAHAVGVVAVGTLGTLVGVKAGVIPPTILEFDAPPPRRPPAAPPTPPPPRTPAPAAAVRTAASRPAPSHGPSRSSGNSGRSHAPRVFAAEGGTGGDSMAVGDGTDFHGGTVGGAGNGPVAPAPVAPPETPAVPSRRAESVEVAEANLAVRAVVDCDDAALSALYPAAALDNEVEVTTLPMELVIAPDGSLAGAHARGNPGFGIAAAMEQGALRHCRVTTVPRDARGAAVRTRVVKRLRFLFE